MQALQTDRAQAPDNDFERLNGISSERVYVLDLDTREITVPSQEQVLGSVDNHISHTALTDAGLIYRTTTDAAPGGNRAISDTIALTTPVAPTITDVPGAVGSNAASTVGDQRFTSVHSNIDSASDVDVFA